MQCREITKMVLQKLRAAGLPKAASAELFDESVYLNWPGLHCRIDNDGGCFIWVPGKVAETYLRHGSCEEQAEFIGGVLKKIFQLLESDDNS
jgi:hypothetical protein